MPAVSLGTIEGELTLKDQFSTVLSKSSARMREMAVRFGEIGGMLTQLGATITVPVAGVAAATLKMATDVVESENLFEVSFGRMADAARDWSEETADALRLNRFELRRQAGVIFTMTESMGLAEDAALDLATGVTELAGDMASFFNLPVEQAFQKLRSGLVGEAEPLRQLGILVDQNTIKQAALRHGLIEVGEELTNVQKVQARWLAIQDQTIKVTGDLARTLESPANKIRAIRTQFTEMGIKLGTALLPLLDVALEQVDRLSDVVSRLVDWFGNLNEPMRTAVVVLAALVGAAGPLIILLGQAVIGVGAIVGSFPGLVLAVKVAAGVIAGPAGLVAAIGSLLLVFKPTRDLIINIATRVFGLMKTNLFSIINAWKRLSDETEPARRFMAAFAKVVMDDVVFSFKLAWRWVGDLVSGFQDWVSKSSLAQTAIVAIGAAMDTLVGILRTAWDWWGKLLDRVIEMGSGLDDELIAVLKVMNPTIGRAVDKLKDWAERAKNLSNPTVELTERFSEATSSSDELGKSIDASEESLRKIAGTIGGGGGGGGGEDLTAKVGALSEAISDQVQSWNDETAQLTEVEKKTLNARRAFEQLRMKAAELNVNIDDLTEAYENYVDFLNRPIAAFADTISSAEQVRDAITDWSVEGQKFVELVRGGMSPMLARMAASLDRMSGGMGGGGELNARPGFSSRLLAGLQVSGFQGEHGRQIEAFVESMNRLKEATKKASGETRTQAEINRDLAVASASAATAAVGLLDSFGMLNDKQKELSSQLGQLGGFVGSFFGPVGAAVGQAAGSVLGVIIGAFDSADKTFGRFAAEAGRLEFNLLESSNKLTDSTNDMADAVIDAFNSIADSFDATIEGVGDLAIQIFKGKGDPVFKTWVDGVKREFDTAEAAIQDAITRGLQTVQFGGLSPIARAALENFAGDTIDELQGAIAFALDVERLQIPRAQRQLAQQLDGIVDMFERVVSDLGGVGGAAVLGELNFTLQTTRDQLLGVEKDRRQQLREQIAAWNAQRVAVEAQLIAIRAELEGRKAEIEAVVAAADAHVAGATAFLDTARFVGEGFKGMSEAGLAFASTTGVVTQAQLDSLDQITSALGMIDEAIAGMPDLITPGETRMAVTGLADPGQSEAEREREQQQRAFDRATESAGRFERQLLDIASPLDQYDRQLRDISLEYEEQVAALTEVGADTTSLNEAYDAATAAIEANRAAAERLAEQQANQAKVQDRMSARQDRASFFSFAADAFDRMGKAERAAEMRARQEFLNFKLTLEENRLRIISLAAEGRNVTLMQDVFDDINEWAKDLTLDDFLKPLDDAGDEFKNKVTSAANAFDFADLGDQILSAAGGVLGESEDVSPFADLIAQIQAMTPQQGAIARGYIAQLLAAFGDVPWVSDLLEGAQFAGGPNPFDALVEFFETLEQIEQQGVLDDLTADVSNFLDSLERGEFGGVAPFESLDAAKQQFQDVIDAIAGGDMSAIEDFRGVSENLLRIAGDMFNSGPEFQRLLRMVINAGEDIENLTAEDFGVSDDEFNAMFSDPMARMATNMETGFDESVSVVGESNKLLSDILEAISEGNLESGTTSSRMARALTVIRDELSKNPGRVITQSELDRLVSMQRNDRRRRDAA